MGDLRGAGLLLLRFGLQGFLVLQRGRSMRFVFFARCGFCCCVFCIGCTAKFGLGRLPCSNELAFGNQPSLLIPVFRLTKVLPELVSALSYAVMGRRIHWLTLLPVLLRSH